LFLAIADDWGWPNAGAYGDPVVETPSFDRIAREGILFSHAFVSSPSCTPSRGALLTGQFHWRLEECANLWSTLPAKFVTYPEVLEDAGYFLGHTRKAWGPGRLQAGGRKQDPTGPAFAGFAEFLAARPAGQPFCYWFGTSDPHRPYEWQWGAASGMSLERVQIPGCLPDTDIVRHDIADYLLEVQRFDREFGAALKLLEETGELENTLVVVTGDHGMPFPRGKSNLYDLGTHVPLAIRWGQGIDVTGRCDDFVSLTDLAPTLLECAGLRPPPEMTGRSLMPILTAEIAVRAKIGRQHVIFGKERHVPSQEIGNLSGYPSRAIRTHEFLYIRNYRPELWPNGVPDAAHAHIGNSFADCDNGPTKTLLMERQQEPEFLPFFTLAFAKRPAEELYDLARDPSQVQNVADDPAYAEAKQRLAAQLTDELRATGDPRETGGSEQFDEYPYYGARMSP
jgi:arylsulfatase A-like enzyme